ncbi:MAG: FAD-dependent oxidoreductase [Proteobacteria bacterium]|nr:FAD-dependent oxidoreductase [Pseudomonadota bacterium]
MSDEKPIVYQSLDELPETVVSEASMLWNKTGSWRYLRPKYLNKVPPCNQGCPAGNDVEGFIRLIGEEKYTEAWRLLKEENPFPKVCGRVCYHPCETLCNRSEFDHSIAIHTLERFAADQAPSNEIPEKLRKETGKTAAIIGSGPAGLTAAYHLARMGHSVTVFEAQEKPGGLLRYGIPDYRLPKNVLDSEIDDILALGVEIRCNSRVGDNVEWEEIAGYDTVFVSIGVHKNRQLAIEGEKAEGVVQGLDFLGSVTRHRSTAAGGNVVVVGGGNSALDSARCALRLGSSVSIYYHRSRNEMPAYEEEISEAEREGVAIHYLTQPVKIITQNDRAVGIQFRRTKLGNPDESGRRRPVPLPGTEFNVDAETIITAIGESADVGFLPPEVRTVQGRIIVNEFGLTRHPGVFAGGDAALSTHNVATAIGSGKSAACAMDSWLTGKTFEKIADGITIGEQGSLSVAGYLEMGRAHFKNAGVKKVVSYSELNTSYFEQQARSKKRKLSIDERISGFSEVDKGLSEKAVKKEAERCFHCGVCTLCDNCYIFCPDVAVSRNQEDPQGYDFSFDYCKGCGICAHECPRSVIIMEEEQ